MMKFGKKFEKITKAHADKSLKKSNKDSQGQIALARNIEDQQHAHENQGSLANDYGKHVERMTDKYFGHRYT
jgi:hypothetical protein